MQGPKAVVLAVLGNPDDIPLIVEKGGSVIPSGGKEKVILGKGSLARQ